MSELQTIEPNAIAAITKTELETSIQQAMQYPRDVQTFANQALATIKMSPEIASSCGYKVPLGDGEVFGPSVRLAEIIFGLYKNLTVATRIIGNDGKRVTAQAVVRDFENNITYSAEVVRNIHKVDRNTGRTITYSESVVKSTMQAAQAIAFRDAIFKVVPKAIVDALYDQAMLFVEESIEKSKQGISAERDKCIQAFFAAGVTVDKLLRHCKVDDAEKLTAKNIAELRAVYSAIKNKETTAEDVFGNKILPHIELQKTKKLKDNTSNTEKVEKAIFESSEKSSQETHDLLDEAVTEQGESNEKVN